MSSVTTPAVRIIPCLDVDNGRVVKGVRFVDISDAGSPVEAAKRYNDMGADELVFLDITASHEGRQTIVHIVESVARQVFIPLMVGGGVATLDDVHKLLNAGSDKVAINSAAVANPRLVEQVATKIGSQCIAVAIDAKRKPGTEAPGTKPQWEVYTHGGRRATGLDAVSWAKTMADAGAGEILLTSMDKDGTQDGFDLEITRTISMTVPIPVIASGGVGHPDHLVEGATKGKADAVLAASIFHFGKYSIRETKQYMRKHGVHVRL